ncbi:PE-PGRS family protein [Dyadobacter sp. CY261]|uniref:PE-PGRS family protein n=1 Tax=Dyadobacter sp. CY261 TaxID=2907203 RepID=UPI001F18E430|nr:PE-PGRS family protein [Dyadobacter sp. CY261]MCF0074505.1 PE-PGRS family protein [Dyadobacter sp. CY261]
MKVYGSMGGQARLIISSLVFCVTCSCGDPEPAPGGSGQSDQFETAPEQFPIAPGIIDEASGLAASATMAGYLWTIQDSGQPNSLYLISKDGKSIKEYNVPGSNNHDWEEVVIGPGPDNGVSYAYIADIGNNNSPVTSTNIIYRIPEITSAGGSFSQNALQKITFSYPDGPRDAEALIVDPQTKDIFIISKEMQGTNIYRLAYPQSTSDVTVAEKVGTVPGVTLATASSISKDGSEVVVRTYLGVFYWKRNTGETVGQTLMKSATKTLTVALEPQGEAICFETEGKGFYTLSEKGNAASVSLSFYKRK